MVSSWVAFFAVPGRYRPHVITASGLVFYLLFAPQHLWLIVTLVVLTFVLTSRGQAGIAVAVVIAALAYYKLPDGLFRTDREAAVPLGLSFLSFELIHYAIERARGRLPAAPAIDLAAFAAFVPCRPAGPIKRYADFTKSVATAARSADDVTQGCIRILTGLVKKVAIADTLASAAPPMTNVVSTPQAWLALLAYSFQIYVDFSAYSDIAIGISRTMGIRVPENFDWPYLSPNIQEFWNRWHISLSSWARDYVFASVGRQLFRTPVRRRPELIASASYMATFLVIGAWHGLTLNFLTWGAYHGLLVTTFRQYRQRVPERIASSPFYQSRPAAWAGSAVTFLLVSIGWVFFRLDAGEAFKMLLVLLHA